MWSIAIVQHKIVSDGGRAATCRRAMPTVVGRTKADNRSPGRALATFRTRSGRADGEEMSPARSVPPPALDPLGESEGARELARSVRALVRERLAEVAVPATVDREHSEARAAGRKRSVTATGVERVVRAPRGVAAEEGAAISGRAAGAGDPAVAVAEGAADADRHAGGRLEWCTR